VKLGRRVEEEGEGGEGREVAERGGGTGWGDEGERKRKEERMAEREKSYELSGGGEEVESREGVNRRGWGGMKRRRGGGGVNGAGVKRRRVLRKQ